MALYTCGVRRGRSKMLYAKVGLAGTNVSVEFAIVPGEDEDDNWHYADRAAKAIRDVIYEGRADIGDKRLDIWVEARERLGYEDLGLERTE